MTPHLNVTAVLILVLILVGFGNSVKTQLTFDYPEGSVLIPIQRVLTEQSSGIEKARRLVIRDPSTWHSVWRKLTQNQYPSPVVPEVNFDQNMLIFAAMGMRRTGGHEISIEKVYSARKGLFVVVRELSPGPGCMTTQGLVFPAEVVLIPKRDKPVEFVQLQSTRTCE